MASASSPSPASGRAAAFQAVLHAAVARYGGGHFTGLVLHDRGGTWSRSVGGSAGDWAYYWPEDGTVHLSPRLSRQVRRVRRGVGALDDIYDTVHTLGHELHHATSGGDGDNTGYSALDRADGRALGGNALHTVEEGVVDALARLDVDRLARELGVWTHAEHLRLAHFPDFGTYPSETHVMNALCAAACGQLRASKLHAGAYAQPEALPVRAVATMEHLHRTVALRERPAVLAARIAAHTGRSESAVRRRVSRALWLPKRPEFRWTRTRVRGIEGRWRWMDVEPREDFAPALAVLLDPFVAECR